MYSKPGCASSTRPAHASWSPFFNGNYHQYEADKIKRLGAEGAQPKRIRFKPLK